MTNLKPDMPEGLKVAEGGDGTVCLAGWALLRIFKSAQERFGDEKTRPDYYMIDDVIEYARKLPTPAPSKVTKEQKMEVMCDIERFQKAQHNVMTGGHPMTSSAERDNVALYVLLNHGDTLRALLTEVE